MHGQQNIKILKKHSLEIYDYPDLNSKQRQKYTPVLQKKQHKVTNTIL